MGACLSQIEKFAAHEIKDVVVPIIVEDVKREIQNNVKYLPSTEPDTPQ